MRVTSIVGLVGQKQSLPVPVFLCGSPATAAVFVKLGSDDVVEVGIGGGSSQDFGFGRALSELNILVDVLERLGDIDGVRGALPMVSASSSKKVRSFGAVH